MNRAILSLLILAAAGCGGQALEPAGNDVETWSYGWSGDPDAPTLTGSMTVELDGDRVFARLAPPDSRPDLADGWDWTVVGTLEGEPNARTARLATIPGPHEPEGTLPWVFTCTVPVDGWISCASETTTAAGNHGAFVARRPGVSDAP